MSYIIIPKKRPIIRAGQMHLGLKGFMRFQVWRPDSVLNRCRIDTGWFPNKILSNGRNNMNTVANWLTHCRVGTNNTPPTAADTQLLAQVAQTSDVVSNTVSTQATPPYYGFRQKTFRFAVGAGHGGQNLSEAGIGWNTTGSTLVSRARIIDPITQLPTTVSPQTDEILDVSYELRYYPPLIDIYNSVTLDAINYDTITRAATATGNIWSDSIGTTIGQESPYTSSWRAFDGNLGTIIQDPSGLGADNDNSDQYNEAYVNNSYQIVMVSSCGPTGWRLTNGIRSIRIHTSAGAYQTQFSSNPGGNTIPKTISGTQYTMLMKWVLGWGGLNVVGLWDMIAASDATTPASGEWNTNTAGSILRVNWTDQDLDNQQTALQLASGSTFRISDNVDPTKWVEYSVTGAYTEYGSWTEYPISQTDIQNGGPTVGNECTLKNLDL